MVLPGSFKGVVVEATWTGHGAEAAGVAWSRSGSRGDLLGKRVLKSCCDSRKQFPGFREERSMVDGGRASRV